ncbi:MAG TPA: ATP-binding protein [Kofleriaceae bacterium]|nr:ATP-binding protein [Kofleriaceae bacterium]
MYLGSRGGDGVLHLVLELVGNAFDLHLAGRCSTIELELDADGTITVRDDGPGLPADGRGAQPALDTLLTTPSGQPTVDGHRPHVHLGLGIGWGLFLANAFSAHLEIVTVHDGVEARARYARGEVLEPATTSITRKPAGTLVRCRPDPEIFSTVRVPRVELTRQLEALTFLAPKLTLRWRIAGDDEARAGLAAWVASTAEREVEEVARHAGTYGEGADAIDVDLALAWEPSGYQGTPPRIDSFVNYVRSADGGSHVDGLLDGICTFLGNSDRTRVACKLVAAVAVVKADVKFGNPTRDRLATPEVRAPVAAATLRALSAWEAA